MNTTGSEQAPRQHYDFWFVTLAAILFGTVVVGGHYFSERGLSLYEIALFPLLLTFLLVLPNPILWRNRPSTKYFGFFCVYGLIGALAELAQFGAVVRGLPLAVTALLLYSQPIWTCLLAAWLLEERISRRKSTAILLTILGVALIVKGEPQIGAYDAVGLGSALLGGFFISLWVIWGRKSGIADYNYLFTTAAWSGSSVTWLILIWPVFASLPGTSALTRISIPSVFEYLPHLTLFAIIAGVIPALLLFKGLHRVPASTAGIILLLEPVSASLLGVFIFSQELTLSVLSGGVLILLANAIVATE